MAKYKEKISFFQKYLVWVIAIGPLFTQYVAFLDFILIPELLIIPTIPICIIKRKKINTGVFKPLIFYLYTVFLLTLLAILLQQNVNISVAATAFARFSVYVLIIIFISSTNFNIDYGSKVVVIVAAFNSIYGIIQYGAYTLYGKVLPWHLSFLKVKYGTKLIQEHQYYFSEFGYRFSGLFSEPAHFSQYVSFALLIVLFFKSEKFNLGKFTRVFLAILYSFVMILNGSGTGFAMLIFIFGLFTIKNITRKNKNALDLLIKFSVIIGIGISVFFIVNSTILSNGYTRISKISQESTTNVRVLRPFEVYYNIPTINKLIGVGYANYSTYVVNSGMASNYELMANSAWTNTIGYVLVGSGLIGFTTYSWFYIKLLKSTKGFYKYLVLMLIVFAFFTEVPLSFQFVTIMSYILQGVLQSNLSSEMDKFSISRES